MVDPTDQDRPVGVLVGKIPKLLIWSQIPTSIVLDLLHHPRLKLEVSSQCQIELVLHLTNVVEQGVLVDVAQRVLLKSFGDAPKRLRVD